MASTAEAYLVLEVAEKRFGIEVVGVEAVLAHPEAGPMPQCPPGFLGGAVHHGEFLGLIPLAALLGLPERLDAERALVAVLSLGGGLVGLVAEGSHGILRPGDAVEEAHLLGRWEGPLAFRTLRVGDTAVHLLDSEALRAALAARIAGE